MSEKRLKTKVLQKVVSLILPAMILVSAIPCTVFAEESTDIITSFTELKMAISAANDGDILYVGDIDFTPSGNIFNSLMRIETDKSLTIKSGKATGRLY